MNSRTDSRKPGVAKQALAYVLAIAMVLSCNGWVGPVTAAWAQQNSTEAEQAASSSSDGGSASSAASTSDASEASSAPASTPAAADVSAATSSSAASSADSSTSSTTSEDAKPAEQAPVHKKLTGLLYVYLDTALDGAASDAPATVTVQLQKRTQTWDAGSSSWSAADSGANHGWTDVDTESGRVVLTSQQVKDAVAASKTDSNPDNDGAAYAFDGLEVQSVTDAGAYQTRTQYRALVTGVDAKSADADNVTYASEDGSAKTATYTVDADATASGSASYTVTVSNEAGLVAEGSDADAESAAAHARKIGVAGTSVAEPAEDTDATSAGDDQSGASDTQGADASASQAPGQENPLVSLLSTLAQSIGLTAAQPTPTVVPNEDGSTTYTYTIHNDMQNYASDGAVSFALGKLPQSASVAVTDASGSAAKVTDGAFSVSAASAADVKIAITVTDVDLTAEENTLTIAFVVNTADSVNKTNRCENYGTAAQTLTQDMTFYSQQAASNVTVKADWYDNRTPSADKPGVSFTLESKGAPGTDGWGTGIYGYDTGAFSFTGTSANKTSNSSDYAWVYSFDKQLYTKAYTDRAWHDIDYRLAQKSAPDGYASWYEADDTVSDGLLVNAQKQQVAVTVDWRDDSNAFGTRPSDVDLLGKLTLTRSLTAGDSKTISLTTTDPTAEGYVVVAGSGNTLTLTLPNCLGYDASGNRYHYGFTTVDDDFKASGDQVPSDTVYAHAYTNAGDYASRQTAVYSGGTLKLTLSNEASFSIKKAWKDDGAADTVAKRPSATFTLYRFADTAGSNYQSASPVPLVDAVTVKGSEAGTGTQTISIAPTDGTSKLPYFNEDGVPYRYFAKEAVADSGQANGDTYAPVRVDADGKEIADSDNPNYDVFNDETVENRISGSTDLTASESWVAAARQDVNAKVTFTLGQSVNGKVTGDCTRNGETVTMSGFGAEATTLTASYNELKNGSGANESAETRLPKYDSDGQPFAYNLSVASVQLDENHDGTFSDDETATIYQDGDKTYLLSANGYRYETTVNVTDNGNASKTFAFTNTLVGNAEVDIAKSLPQGFKQTWNDQTRQWDKDSSASFTYTVYQNDQAIGTKTLAFAADDAAADGSVASKSLQITRYDDLAQTGDTKRSGELPRYDAQGNEYVYTVKETDAGGYASYESTSTDEKDVDNTAAGAKEKVRIATSRQSNTWKSGNPSIRIGNIWNDGGEKQYRKNTTFKLLFAPQGANSTWKEYGTYTISNDTGFVDVAIDPAVLNKITSSSSYAVPPQRGGDGSLADRDSSKIYTDDLVAAWRNNGYAQKPNASSAAFKVVESTIGEGSTFYAGDSTELGTDTFKKAHPEHLTGDFITATDQNYDVTYESQTSNDGVGLDLGIVNTRVGVEYVELVKNWNGGNNQGKTRPDSISVTVSATDAQATYSSKTYRLTAADNAVSGNSSQWKLTTEPLRKYNDKGEVIAYSVSDETMNFGDAQAENHYTHRFVHAGYTVGSAHTGDVDRYEYTNTLTGTVRPYMNKYWKDMGDEDPSIVAARPDIQPVLYRSWTDENATGGDSTVSANGAYTHYEKMGFTERDWNTKEVTADWWQCTFTDVPRYNAAGYEYTYYIAEKWASQTHGKYVESGAYAEEPSHTDTTTSYTEATSTPTSITYNGVQIPVAQYYYAHGDEAAHAGTIVNRLEEKVTISGEKSWKNIPAELDQSSNLIDVTFHLQRVKHDDYAAWKAGDGSVKLEDAKASDGTRILKDVTKDDGTPVSATITSRTRTFTFDTQVDKYDIDGEPYVYFVKEVEPKAGLAFQFADNPDDGLQAINTFNSDQNLTISFDKTWDFGLFKGQIPDNLRPTSTLTLVRYLTDKAGSKIAGTREAAFAQAGTGEGQNTNTNTVSLTWDGSSAKQTLAWTHLAYLAPNGNPYHYEVEESNSGAVMAYQAKAADGTSNLALTSDTGSYNAIADVTTAPSYSNGTISAGSGAAAMTNVYGSKTGAVTVTKSWNDDENYALQTRPDQITFQLERSYTDNAGATVTENVSLADAAVAKGRITGTTTSAEHSYGKVAESDEAAQFALSADAGWSTTIEGLQQYAPNGSAYRYKVKEVSAQKAGQDYDLSAAYTTSSPGGVFADGSTYTVTNTLNVVGASFKKTWKKDLDGTTSDLSADDIAQLVQSNALPASIKVRYKYAYQKDDTWSDWADVTQTSGSTTEPVERTLTFNAKTGTYRGATTISNFPRYTVVDGQLCPTRYVAYEYALTYANDATDVTANAVPSGANAYTDDAGALAYRFAAAGVSDAGISGTLVRSEASTDGAVGSYDSTVVNTIPVKQLTVRKTWDDDGNRDGYRPTSLAFTVTRDSAAVTDGITLTSGDALPSDAYTGGTGAISYTIGNGPDWDALGKNQEITAKDVWQKTLLVPVWKNVVSSSGDASSYQVAESALDDNYQKTFQYNDASGASDYTVAGATAANDLDTTGTRAFFVNVHAPWDTFSIAPSKTWYYNGHKLGGTDSPALLAAYAQKLADSDYKLALQLQYKLDGVDGKSSWQAIDADGNSDFEVLNVTTGDDGKISAQATGASLASVATARSIGADGTVAFDYALNKTENGTTTTVTRDGATSWAGLPLYWHTGDASAQKIPYQYRIVEGYVDGKGTFTAIDGTATGALTNFASDHSTGHTDADVIAGATEGAKKDGTATATASNTLKTTGITVAKNWTDTNNAYQSRPDSVSYHLEYTSASDDSAWQNVPQGWALGTGRDAAGTATVTLAKGDDGSFASQTVNNLPARDASGNAYRYRAVEDSYTYGTGSTAKTYTVGTTVDSATDGKQNPYYADATDVTSSDGTATFANNLVTTRFKVTKSWVGDDAWKLHDDIDHVTVKLQHRSTSDGAWTDVPSGTYNLKAGENWSHIWTDLPKIDGATGNDWEYRGVEVSYTLTADKGGATVPASYATADDPTSGTVGAYDYSSQTNATTGDDPATTIADKLITGTVNASKKWDDDNNRDNKRPAEVSLSLSASGTQGLTLPTMDAHKITVTTSGTADKLAADEPTSWTDLPVYDASGAKISYTVGEAPVAGYTATAPAAVQMTPGEDGTYAATAGALVNARTPQITKVTANKSWADNNDYGDRPGTVSYTLHAKVDGAELSASDLKVSGLTDLSRTVDVKSDGTASTTWENLPVHQPGQVGKKITYKVTEAQPTGYKEPAVGDDTGDDAKGHAFSVTNTMPYTSLTVSKSWTDDFGVNKDIANVSFALQRSDNGGTAWTDLPNKTYDLQKAQDGSWPSVTLDNLPAKNTTTGKDYVYRAVETGYKLVDGTTVVTAVPSSASTADGKLSGTVGAYTYASTVDTAAKTTELDNTLVLGSLKVSKAFDDANNQDAKRPDSIGIALTDDKGIDLGGKANKTIAIVNAADWSQSWAGNDALPVKAADGSAVTYTATETDYNAKATDGNAYAGSYAVNAGSTQRGDSAQVTLDAAKTTQVAFTNTEVPDTVDVTATKKWDDNNAFGDRPTNVTFALHASYKGDDDNDIELSPEQIAGTLKAATSKTLSADNAAADDAKAWTTTWSGLPKNMPGQVGKQLTYWVTEDTTPAGYAQKSDDVQTTVTNTMDKKTKLTVTSSWKNEIYGVGAKSATFKLQRSIDGGKNWSDVSTADAANHPVTTTIEKSKENASDDRYTFTDLPMYSAAGKAYSYRAVQTSLTPKADAADVQAKPVSDSDATNGTVGGYVYASSTTGSADAGFKTSNTNTMTRGTVTVTKSYKDAENQDGTRPESATFTLSADQTLTGADKVLQEKTIDTPDRVNESSDGWAYTWSYLPTQMADGTTINYTVTEAAVDGYTASYGINGGTATDGNAASTPATSDGVTVAFTNTHNPATTSVTASKKWDDSNNAYGDRPDMVSYTLHATVDNKELSVSDLKVNGLSDLTRSVDVASDSAGAATVTWGNLPVYQPGQQGQTIAYTVTEAQPAGYKEPAVEVTTDSDADGHAFEVINALDPLTYTVEKKWENEPGFLAAKAGAATFKLQRTTDGKDWADVDAAGTKTVDRRNADSAQWDGLPKCDKDGHAYSYRAVETSIDVGDQTVAVTPAEGDPTSGTVGGYTYSSAVNEGGQAKTTVTNTFRTAKLSIFQSWDDDHNRDGKRQAKTVTVSADQTLNGMPAAFTLAIGKDAGLADEIDNLPVTDAAGNPITYTVAEDAVDGYSTSYTLSNDKGKTPVSTTLEKGDATVSIANAYTPATTSVTATKLWNDQSNSYGDRPEKVQFTLYAQPEGGERYQVSKDESDKAVANPVDVKGDSKQNEWTTTWSNLPVYQKGEVGKKIAYTVEETAVAGYTKKEDGLSVTNTQDTTSLTATKTWGEDPANIGRDVAGVTIALQRSADGSSWADLAEQKVDKAGASQLVSWTGLPTHDKDGKAYQYRAVEKGLDLKAGTELAPTGAESGTVGGYDYTASTTYKAGSDEQSRPGTGSYAATITNTPTSGSLRVTKKWDDDDNRDNLRAPVTATLSAKAGNADYSLGTVDLDQTLSADGWDCTWNNLPVADAAGNKLAYTVAEGDVPEGYTKTQGSDTHELVAGQTTSFSLENTHTPETTTVTATKNWDDRSNLYGDRPENVEFLLHASYTDDDGTARELTQSQIAGILKADTVRTLSGDSDEWQTIWKDLPVYFHGQVGKKLTYWVSESQPAKGYTATPSSDSLTIDNSLDGLAYTVACDWTDEPKDYLPHLGDKATFKLERSNDGGKTWSGFDKAGEKTVTRTQDSGDEATWEKLPQFDKNGNAYSYRAVETSIDVDGAQVAVGANAGETSGTVGGYAYSSAVNEGGSAKTVVTNAFQTGSLQVTKTWSDDNDRDGARTSATVTVTPSAQLNVFPMELDVSADSTKSTGLDQTIAGLPVTDAAGTPITYGVSETAVTGYETSYEATGGDPSAIALTAGETATATVTNTHIPGTISVTANKTWADQDNNTGFRPENVTYTLQMQHSGSADWAAADSKVLPKGVAATQKVDVTDDAAGAASATWDSLPAFYPGAVGDQVHYRVVEEPAAGYTTTYDASDVTGASSDADAGKAVTVTNTLDPVTYSFAKTDESGAPLAGTTLTLAGIFANADGTTVEETRTVLGGSATQDLTGNSLIKGASYTLKEATAADGYTYVEDATLTVGDDGSLSVVSADGKASVSADGHTVTVSDSPTQVTFKKIDRTDGSDIAKHMRYRVYALGRFAKLARSSYVGDDGSIQAYGQPDTGLYLDGTAAQITEALRGELVATKDAAKPVMYQLQEQEAPAGYQLDPTPVFFIVNPDGTVTQVASATDTTPVENPIAGTSGSTLSFSDPRNIVSFSKQDAEGSELAPASYRVAAAAGSSFADGTIEKTVTTTGEADALAKLDSLLIVGDTYTVTETSAPAGYYLNGETLTFTVNPNGTMQFADADQLESYEGDGSSTLVQKDAPIRFRIHKANAGEGDYDLSGATFSVTPVDAEGEPLITEATDAAGDVDLSNLALAVDTDYTIAETKAPDGFKLDADAVTVHIDADGTVALSGEAPASYTLDAADDGAFVLTCSDEPYVLQLLKTDPDGSALPDASFDVTGQFAGGSTSESVQTDAQGTAKLASLLIPGQTYTLAETAAPAGYQPLAGSAQFTMGEDGKLQVLDDAGGNVKAGDEGTALVVTDQRVVENGTARTGDGLPIGAAAGLLSAAALALFAHLANRRKEEA
ncbi:MAG: Cna B-type domain-containing protein [Coriobacteriales bacterium]|nr:Cna B-type domain-containing protein [Coriobacteriales bacterium]